MLSKFVLDNTPTIEKYIDNFLKEQSDILTNKQNIVKDYNLILMSMTFTYINKKNILNICLFYFLLIYSHRNTHEDQYFASLPFSVKIGKSIFSRYMNGLKEKQNEDFMTYFLY